MKLHAARFAALGAGAAIALAACSNIKHDPPPVTLGPYKPSAAVIATTQPAATLHTVCAMIARSARPNEHVEVVDPNFSAGQVAVTAVTPKAPSMSGPLPPADPFNDPTSYQLKVYQRQRHAYEVKIAADRRALEHTLALSLARWSDTVCTRLSRTLAASGWGARTRAALSDGSAFFSDLSTTGAELGVRKVIVIFATDATAHTVLPVRPDSLSQATVIIANYQGGMVRQSAWRADLHRAGARRIAILVPAAIGELPSAVSQALTANPAAK
jgi:hypothetical protein